MKLSSLSFLHKLDQYKLNSQYGTTKITMYLSQDPSYALPLESWWNLSLIIL
jgi:hypothetical protein